MEEGITAKKLNEYLEKIELEMKASDAKPEVIWITKPQLRVLLEGSSHIRADIQAILDDNSIPDNALLEILK